MNILEKKVALFSKNNKFDINKNKEVFLFHLKEFLQRVKSNTQLSQTIEENMKKEIGQKNMEIAEQLANLLVDDDIKKISQFEIFLISTHISIFRKE